MRRQESAPASFHSANERSKNECGAPSYTFMSCSTPCAVSLRSNSTNSSCGVAASAPAICSSIGTRIWSMTSLTIIGRP
jgi:hypothetical protein